MTRRKKAFIITFIILTLGVALGLMLNLLEWRIPCIFNLLTGFKCAGCGNTRATLALLQFDFKGVLQYNMLYPLEIGYVLWVYFFAMKNYVDKGRFSYKPKYKWVDISVLVLVILWGIIRNII